MHPSFPPRSDRPAPRPATPVVLGLVVLLAAALALAVACGPREAASPWPERPNILLVTIDTLRADHLSAYGYERETSPNLDRLASEGVRFERTTVQWPKTGPSFASMFTATYPKDNRIVRQVGIPLPYEFRMLAEEVRARGYQTLAVVANGAVASDFHFDQGFDTYLESWKLVPKGRGVDPAGAQAINDLAMAAFDTVDPGKPWFAWIHYLDPHAPYTPPEGFRDRFVGDEHFDPSVTIDVSKESGRRQMTGIGFAQVLEGHEDLAFYTARYDAEILYTDAKIGELLGFLRERGLLDQTLTVVTSDHGESLGEHHYFFDHGRFSFETCLHVPLIFHFPGVLEPRVDREPVELLHLAPTVLDAAGVELVDQGWMQGRSLTPRLLGRADGKGGLAFAEAGYATGGKWQKVVRDRRFKAILAPTRAENRWIGGVDVPWALYDLDADPGETENVAERHPAELARLRAALEAWDGAEPFPVLVDATDPGVERGMDEETRRQLKALGYVEIE